MRTREGLPGRSPIAPGQTRLTLEFLVMGFRLYRYRGQGAGAPVGDGGPEAPGVRCGDTSSHYQGRGAGGRCNDPPP
jgi:hypothetical protein